MGNLLLQIVSGILGLFLATKFVSGVFFTGEMQILLLAGAILGLFNFFLKPILKLLTLPLWLLSFGLFSFLINMGLILLTGVIFPVLVFEGILPLFWTTLLISGIAFFISILIP